MQHVLFHYDSSPRLLQRLASLSAVGLEVTAIPIAAADALASELPRTEVLWHVLEPVTRAMIEAAPELRLIQKIGVGVNTIDLAAAEARGVAVCNMPGTNTPAVAEMTLLLMLAGLRRLPLLDRATRQGRGWSLPPESMDGYGEITGNTVGLIGMGAVARRLTPALLSLGARVVYWNRTIKADALATWLPLDELLATADIVSLHLPLAPATVRLMNADRFGRMKQGALLVNTARGGLVDEPALLAALDQGRLRGAALDCFAEEPLPAGHPFLGREDIVLAPHLAWLTPETLERSLRVAVENCRLLRAGEPLLHRVV